MVGCVVVLFRTEGRTVGLEVGLGRGPSLVLLAGKNRTFLCYIIAEQQRKTIWKWQQTWRKIGLRPCPSLYHESKEDGWKSNKRLLLGRWAMSCLTEQTFGSLSMPCSKEMIYEKMSLVLKVRSCCFQTKHNSHVLEENISTEEQWCRNRSRQTYHETIIPLF